MDRRITLGGEGEAAPIAAAIKNCSVTTKIKSYNHHRQQEARILLKLNLPRANHPGMSENPFRPLSVSRRT